MKSSTNLLKNQNEVTSVSNEESESTESLDNEGNQKLEKSFKEISEDNKDNSEESLPDKKSEEETKEPEENKEPEKDLNNIFDGFDFGSIDIGKIGEILNPIPKENEENKDEDLKENPDKQSGEDPKEDQNSEGEIKTENSSTENQDSLFDNIGDLFDKIKDYVKSDDKVIEEIKDEINLEDIDMTVQCDELFFTVNGKAPAGTILKVEKLEENFEDKITENLEESKRFNQLAAFDIKLIKPDGSQYQPIDFGEKVKISVVGLAGNVFRIENDKVTDMQAEFSDEETEFETEHFTTYVIGGVTHTSKDSFVWLGMSCNLYDTDDDGKNETLVITGTQNDEIDIYRRKLLKNNPKVINVKNIILDANVFSCFHLFSKTKFENFLTGINCNSSNLISMRWMFADCSSLKTLDFSNFNTSRVTDMGNMFGGCESIQTLDLSSFDTRNVNDMSYMFTHCKKTPNVKSL